VPVCAALVLNDQVVRPRVLRIGLIDVKCGDVAVFALVLRDVIHFEATYARKRRSSKSERLDYVPYGLLIFLPSRISHDPHVEHMCESVHTDASASFQSK
jgi:hypothetical protein